MSFAHNTPSEISANRLELCKLLKIDDIRIFVTNDQKERFTVMVTNNGHTHCYQSTNKNFFFRFNVFFTQFSWIAGTTEGVENFNQKSFMEIIVPLLLGIREVYNERA